LIGGRNVLCDSFNERFHGLALYLPCSLVVADLEPSRKRPGESDDHENQAHGQESHRAGFEMRNEDSDAACAQCDQTQREGSDAAGHAELARSCHRGLRDRDLLVSHDGEPTHTAVTPPAE
jgi:hypothetical protein